VPLHNEMTDVSRYMRTHIHTYTHAHARTLTSICRVSFWVYLLDSFRALRHYIFYHFSILLFKEESSYYSSVVFVTKAMSLLLYWPCVSSCVLQVITVLQRRWTMMWRSLLVMWWWFLGSILVSSESKYPIILFLLHVAPNNTDDKDRASVLAHVTLSWILINIREY